MIENVKPFLPIPQYSAQEFFKKPIIVLLALTAIAALVGYAVRSLWGRIQILPALDTLYSDGMKAYNNREYRKAIKTFKLVLGRDPSQEMKTKILAARAECYRSIDKWDKALKDFKEVEKGQPQDDQPLLSVHRGKADIYSRQEKYEDAILECNSVLEIEGLSNKEKAKVLFIKGFSLYSLQVYPAALVCFNDAEPLNPSDCKTEAQILFFRAKTYLSTHELDLAFDDLNQARDLNQEDGLSFRSVFKELAQNYAKVGKDEKVMDCYNLAFECAAGSKEKADILVHRGCFQRDKKEPAIGAARADFQKAFELDPKIEDLEAINCWMYGLVCRKENNKMAIEQLENAVNLNPSNKILPRILLALGKVLFISKQVSKAIKKYTHGIYLCVDGETKARLLFHRSKVYESRKKPKRAKGDCKEALLCKFENDKLRKQIQDRQQTLEKMG